MRIALDAMGGDDAPRVVVEGAIASLNQWDDVHLVLIGDEQQIRLHLKESHPRLEIIHTEERIDATEEPVRAVRRKKQASMVLAGDLLKNKQVDAMISAGNTGALMTVGLLVVGRIDGIERPGLASTMPTLDGRGVLVLDLGANMDASPQHLLQYGIMGALYQQIIHSGEVARVGLLNVGSEKKKGNELTKATYELLENSSLSFIGNVEARDLLNGGCDVVVCDGFAGNILLKSMEGAVVAAMSVLKRELTSNWFSKLGALLLKNSFRKFKKAFDYTEHEGALLLGVNGVCIKSHGSSNARMIHKTIGQARKAVQHRLIDSITDQIVRIEGGNVCN